MTVSWALRCIWLGYVECVPRERWLSTRCPAVVIWMQPCNRGERAIEPVILTGLLLAVAVDGK
jgi:hypothetical protein